MSGLNRMAQALLERPPIEPSPIEALRRRNRRRHRHNRIASTAAAGLLVLAVALVGFLLPSGGTRSSTIQLAGYTAHLPSGYTANPAPEPKCRVYPVAVHAPGHLPAALTSAYAVNAPGGTGCLGSWLTASYASGSGRMAPVDPDAPPNGLRENIDGYQAIVGNGNDLVFTITGPLDAVQIEGEDPVGVSVGVWVQIPTLGGGYHDLIIGALGLTQDQVLGLLRSALPTPPAPATAGKPPWATVPPCAPGQSPDPGPDSAQACGGFPAFTPASS